MEANLIEIEKQNREIDKFLNGTGRSNYYNKDYHDDYILLMLVVEKIITLKFEDNSSVTFRTFGLKDNDGDGQIMVRIERHALFKGETLKEALYLAVFDFVKRLREKNNY